jgi:hypothetical protein
MEIHLKDFTNRRRKKEMRKKSLLLKKVKRVQSPSQNLH